MINHSNIRVIIPAFNEEASIGMVIDHIPKYVDEVIVVSNRSTDDTEIKAKQHGATVLSEPRRGYGYACLKGMAYLKSLDTNTDIVVFLDGDYSDFPEELTKIIEPITTRNYDFVIGARVAKYREKGAMTYPQVFGNWLATSLMKLIWQSKFTDLGPFRAIKYSSLLKLKMEDKTYGWTVEMQLKALRHQLKYTEVEVNYRNRIGDSKVSGTLQGAIFAGVKIIGWILKYAIK